MRVVTLILVASILGVPSVFYGDALGLSISTIFLATVIGSMAGVSANLLASHWILASLEARAERKGNTSRLERLGDRATPILERGGMIGLGLVGPVVLGTFGTALIGPALGISRRRVFTALLVGVTFWCAVLAVVSDLLVSAYGVSS